VVRAKASSGFHRLVSGALASAEGAVTRDSSSRSLWAGVRPFSSFLCRLASFCVSGGRVKVSWCRGAALPLGAPLEAEAAPAAAALRGGAAISGRAA
jgi:hypothetical protein